MLEEHLDEARFRWLQWERALEAADVTVEETATGEERLLAQHFPGPVLVEALESSLMRRRHVLAIRTGFPREDLQEPLRPVPWSAQEGVARASAFPLEDEAFEVGDGGWLETRPNP
ncbi:hypothetical protein QEG98_40055 [Myxococcus sp. MxC21-1]|nr:hypothetical protein [Myxococcus sp. MxC21-1]WNZ61959.1 hypothetical protein QEG98_40055 [Myxococcus sp. MxC21-1]